MLRLLGIAATAVAVLLLIGSMIAGLGGAPAADQPESYRVPVSSAAPLPVEPIRVEVLNGAGVSGLARRVTEELRDQGFDVVYYGNAGSLARDSTTILDRSGNAAAAATVGEALGTDRIVTELDTTLYLEATIVLGNDWEDLELPETGSSQ